MMYSIGDIVKNDKSDTCIILASKTTPLTSDYLTSHDGKILIIGIDEMAKKQIHVLKGFDYIIARIKSFEGKYCNLDIAFGLSSAFEDELIR